MDQETEVQFDFAEATDVGRVRELNEDHILCKQNLWLVADGMGGHACGEIASKMAVSQVVECIEQGIPLSEAIQNAHREIVAAGKKDVAKSGMGTTIVAMTGNDKEYQIAWVGDSRAYLWDGRNNQLSQITEDHSLMVRLLRAGLISEEEADVHPQRHMITQCLGSTEIEQVTVDLIENTWESEQQVLLCSDGLTDEVPERLIAEIMSTSDTVDEKAESLICSAKQAGGKDNISVIIVNSPASATFNISNNIRDFIGRLREKFQS